MDIYSLFDKQCNQTPQNIALQIKKDEFTYSQLRNASYRITNMLSTSGVKSGEIICILIKNSMELVASIFAVLKIGAICLPVSPDTPPDRIASILKNSGTRVLLKCSKSSYENIVNNVLSFDVDIEIDKYEPLNCMHSKHNIKGTDPAYCIYTSGSSGSPKGVLLAHAGIINHMIAKRKLLKISQDTTMCLSFSIGFVASIWQILLPLITGATLVLYPGEVMHNIKLLLRSIERDNIETISLIPQQLETYLKLAKHRNRFEPLTSLRNIILTGEVVRPKLVETFYSHFSEIRLINAYGQTECSDDTLHHIIDPSQRTERIPIGKPIENISVMILGDEMRPVSKGEKGELYIAGVGLAIGYLNDTDLNDRNFFINQNNRLYRTGDIVYEDIDGDIVFIGRADNQVKISGHRFELEEIEAYIKQYPAIDHTIVRVIESQRLEVLYSSANTIDTICLQNYLSRKLPNSLLPSKYTRVMEFAYMSNGKIDRQKYCAPKKCSFE